MGPSNEILESINIQFKNKFYDLFLEANFQTKFKAAKYLKL